MGSHLKNKVPLKKGSHLVCYTIMGRKALFALALLGVSSLGLGEARDRCGCPSGEGWSMAKKSCQKGSVTDHWDDCVDRCGCKYPQGWSSTSHHCKTGSATDSHEKCDGGGGND